MPKDTYYFSHDYNCRNDEKIKRLLRKHGMSGYGIFWSIVEDLYNNSLNWHNNIQVEYLKTRKDETKDTDKFLTYPNGWYWINLNTDFSEDTEQARD